jgi:hypothetical protein
MDPGLAGELDRFRDGRRHGLSMCLGRSSHIGLSSLERGDLGLA